MQSIKNFLCDYLRNKSLIDLYTNLQSCDKCCLCKIKINTLNYDNEFSGKLPGYGSEKSKIMFVAQQPSFFRKGFKIFGSPSSNNRTDLYFDIGLQCMGLKRKQVFVTNLVKCSSFKNEPMHDDVISTCARNWFYKELNILQPDVIVAVGSVAADFLTAYKKTFNEFYGFKTISIYHPSYVVRGGMSINDYQKEFVYLKEALINEGIIKNKNKVS